MTGFLALFRLEMKAMYRTWHRYALPVALPVVAVISLVVSRFALEILKAVAGEAYSGPVPGPGWQEAYRQWAQSLSQMGLFIVIFTGASATSSLISSGQAQLLAVRPVSRQAQPPAAFAARAIVACLATVVGTAVLWILTTATYPQAPVGPLVSASLAWLLCAWVLLAVSVALSALLASTLAAVGVTVGAYVVLSVIGLVDPVARNSPAGLISLPSKLATGDGSWQVLPVVTGVLLAALCLALAARSFARREL